MSDTADAVTLDLPDQVLVGPPGHLQGEVHLRNAGPRKVIVREPRIRTRAAQLVALHDQAEEATWNLRRMILRPGQARRIPISLELDPRTPPGVYEVEIDVLGQRRPLTVHVTELVRLAMAPDEVVVENHPGKTVTKTVVLTNRGNVPVTVPKIGSVGLDDEHAFCRAALSTLAE